MQFRLTKHVAGAVALAAFVCSSAAAQEVARVRTRVFDVDYSVNREALPLDSVALWYTVDEGESWHQFGVDEDRQSPITFDAPSEGLFGLFFVVSNSTGPSSQSPTAGTKPHRWVYVDYSPPVVQLHAPRQATKLGMSVLQVRWTAIDGHLTNRPVQLAYRHSPEKTWHPITEEPLANTGKYDWRLPEHVRGAVAVRISVTDKGGHSSVAESEVTEIRTIQPQALSGAPARLVGGESDVPDPDRERALRLLEEGLSIRDAGDHRRAISKLRNAVSLDPQLTEAFVAMAGMLMEVGDLDRSLSAYEIALSQRPTHRGALRGAAMVDRKLYKNDSAVRRLEIVLDQNPNDTEVWLNLGDLAILQGDSVRARECYTYATTRDSNNAKVIEEAQKRLVLMAQASRVFKENN